MASYVIPYVLSNWLSVALFVVFQWDLHLSGTAYRLCKMQQNFNQWSDVTGLTIINLIIPKPVPRVSCKPIRRMPFNPICQVFCVPPVSSRDCIECTSFCAPSIEQHTSSVPTVAIKDFSSGLNVQMPACKMAINVQMLASWGIFINGN